MIHFGYMNKIVMIAILLLAPAGVLAAVPKIPILGEAQIISPTAVRWHFTNRDPKAAAFELWNVITRSMISRIANPKATYIDETNIVPADPDMTCGRYIVAVNAKGERSFGQVRTYPCVRTPPVAPPAPKVEIMDKQIIKVTASSGANDPATAIGILETQRDAWVSPENMFVADPELLTLGGWGTDIGTTLIGLRPNSNYSFVAVAQSVTGEVSKYSAPTVFNARGKRRRVCAVLGVDRRGRGIARQVIDPDLRDLWPNADDRGDRKRQRRYGDPRRPAVSCKAHGDG